METEKEAEQHGTWLHAQSGEGEVGGGSTGTRPGVRVFESVKALLFFIILIGRNETDHKQSEQHDKAVKTMFVSLKKTAVGRRLPNVTGFNRGLDLVSWSLRSSSRTHSFEESLLGGWGGVHGPAA